MRRTMVAGNWKMYGNSLRVAALLEELAQHEWPQSIDLALFPSSLFMTNVIDKVGHIFAVGAQNCAECSDEGALTGEIASAQLADVGCQSVLVGHSERRHLLGETDVMVAKKFAAAQSSGLTPILCVGETLAQRQAGTMEQVIVGQLAAVVQYLNISAFNKAIVAYEPVWAIGTGQTATPEQAQVAHQRIRAYLGSKDVALAERVCILYGGSLKPANAADLFAMPDVDGGLVGGASLNANEFAAICCAAGVKNA